MFTLLLNTTISELQAGFRDHFPFLRIEFFRTLQSPDGTYRYRELISPEHLLNARGLPAIQVKDDMRVCELQQVLLEYCGVWAQVLRKSAGSWLETTMTADWTLGRQNEEGRELSCLI